MLREDECPRRKRIFNYGPPGIWRKLPPHANSSSKGWCDVSIKHVSFIGKPENVSGKHPRVVVTACPSHQGLGWPWSCAFPIQCFNFLFCGLILRYPLIIDPSGQATEFIMNEYKDRKITRTSFLDDAFRKNLESALRFGNPLLVQVGVDLWILETPRSRVNSFLGAAFSFQLCKTSRCIRRIKLWDGSTIDKFSRIIICI